MNIRDEISRCATVADLLDLRATVHAGGPPPPNGNPATAAYKAYREAVLLPVEDEVVAALSHYGPAVWGGLVWWCHLPPRAGRVNHAPVRRADQLPWGAAKPAEPAAVLVAGEATPEKAWGYCAQQHH